MRDDLKVLAFDYMHQPGFKLAKGRLRDADGGLCGNGVICELAVQAGIAQWDAYGIVPKGKLFGWVGMPPKAVRDWAGMTPGECWRISEFNDKTDDPHAVAEFIKNEL